jgi:tRNA pseudouridine55 synthase
VHGILVVDKPPLRSSAGVVEHVKRALGAERAGHGGTLDPLATGVLPICINAGTKLAQYLLADDKAYEATGILGVETDTLDRTGRVLVERPVAVTADQLLAALERRLGEQSQVPPMFSAIKQGGVRLYQRARAGEEVEREPRKIRIGELALIDLAPPRFTISIACSKGTYVRSLVADLGTDLGCGAHLAELRRTRSGAFSLAQAIPLEAIPAPITDAWLAAHLIPLGRATALPSVVANPAQLGLIRSGLQLPLAHLGGKPEQFQIVDEAQRLVAIAHGRDDKVIYDRVFPSDATS